MSEPEVWIVGGETNDTAPLLVTIVRDDECGLYGDQQSCHLFAYRGKEGVDKALAAAIKEYLREKGDTYVRGHGQRPRPMDWFEMMVEREDYGEIFAKYGLTELRIPMGMTSFVFCNGDPLADYLEAY